MRKVTKNQNQRIDECQGIYSYLFKQMSLFEDKSMAVEREK